MQRITYAHYLHGYWARKGNRAVEVIRTVEWGWMCYATIDHEVCKAEQGVPDGGTKEEAMLWAQKFLAGEITPECWPGVIDHIPKANYKGKPRFFC